MFQISKKYAPWRLACKLSLAVLGTLGLTNGALAAFVTFEANGLTPASITAKRDAFRASVGGGSAAAANGDFGGVRREINWDGVPGGFSDPSLLPANFFNMNSPRGAVFSTPGTGFMVSSTVGTPLFGFSGELQTFSPSKLFATLGSNVMDIDFFLPGTLTAATTSAFGLVFVDVENANETMIEFFNASNSLLYSRFALAGSNQGLSFVGGVATAGERIAKVRITMPNNFLLGNGVRANETNDFVVMDDFLYATPAVVPEGGSLALVGMSLLALAWVRRPTPQPNAGALLRSSSALCA